jgi:hypothetical protein
MAAVVLTSGIFIFLYTRNCAEHNKTNLTHYQVKKDLRKT